MRQLDGKRPGGWVPEQKIAVEEALVPYTSAAAHATFQEDGLGTLAPGKLADLVVIDRDLTAVAPAALREARVVMKIVGGRAVYSTGSALADSWRNGFDQ